MANETETRVKTNTITMAELAQAFKGKYVDASCAHLYGIVIGICDGTIDYDDTSIPKLCITSRDTHGSSMGTLCIWSNGMEKIEEKDGRYSIATPYMPTIEISEHAFNEE